MGLSWYSDSSDAIGLIANYMFPGAIMRSRIIPPTGAAQSLSLIG